MSETTKTHEQVHADPDAFSAAYVRARQVLGAIPGVLGVGYGHVSTGGEFRVGLGFQAFVREKKDLASLPSAERIPRSFEGYRVDVRVIQSLQEHESLGDLYRTGTDTRERVIMGGIQIEPRKKTLPPTGPCQAVGTLGCLVKRRRQGAGDDNLYLLTCDHVLAAAACVSDDDVYHPYASKSTDPLPGVRLGKIQLGGFRGEVNYGIFRPYIDCAIAKIDVGSTCCGSACGDHRIAYEHKIKGLGPTTTLPPRFTDEIHDVRDVCGDTSLFVQVPRDGDGQVTTDDVPLRQALDGANPPDLKKVRKVGRSTGRTVGIVVGVNSIGMLGRGDAATFHHDVIEILLDPTYQDPRPLPRGRNRFGRRRFAEQGDSGSIVVDHENRAIGIAFGGPGPTDRAGSEYDVTWASHIVPVLDKLDVCIVTAGGASRGSDKAKDGSGLLASRTPDPAHSPAVPLSSTTPAPATGSGVEPALAAARARLLATPAGREIFALLDEHQREISYIVRNTRKGKSTWHRLEGPAFLAQALAHLRAETPRMPNAIRGVRRSTLLARLRLVLMSEGGPLLQRALEEHGEVLLALADVETFDDALAILERRSAAEPVA